MKVLVTGGAGYVGCVLAPQLLDAGHEVIVFDALRFGGWGMLPLFLRPEFSFVQGDVNDAELVRRWVSKADAVIHLAAIVGYPACLQAPELAERTNVGGVRNVVSALSHQQLLIYAATGSSYGAVEGVCTEDSPLNPVSLYGVTKAEGERLALQASNAAALRFATAFGVSPRLRLDLLVNDFVRMALVEKRITLFERHFRRSFIHVHDMARAFLFALDHFEALSGQVFNVGHESLNLTKEQIALAVRSRVAFDLQFANVGSDLDKRDYEVNYEKIRSVGFDTVVGIDAGIDELVNALQVIDLEDPPHIHRNA